LDFQLEKCGDAALLVDWLGTELWMAAAPASEATADDSALGRGAPTLGALKTRGGPVQTGLTHRCT